MKSTKPQSTLLTGVILAGALQAAQPAEAQVKPAPSQQAAKTLEGRWRASSMIVQWAFGEWGKACGPKPTGKGQPGGIATITKRGAELQISGPGRSFSTATCWEQYPGLSRTGHRAGSRNWSTTCRTAKADPRRATVRTTVSASDNRVNFDETGQYQFQIKGQNCTASSRRTRSYSLIQRSGGRHEDESGPVPAVTEPPGPKKKSTTGGTKSGKCARLGTAQKIEVSPSRKLMRSGETFAFRTVVADARGCQLAPSLAKWRLVTASDFVEVSPAGSVRVLENSPDAKLKLIAKVGEETLQVTVDVVSEESYDQLLAGGDFTLSGESRAERTLTLTPPAISKTTALGEDAAGTRKLWFVGVSGTVALLIGGIGVALMRQGRHRKQRAPKSPRGAPPPSEKRRTPGVQLNPHAASQAKVCPQCGTLYAGDSQFCGRDGSTLRAN